MINIYVKFILVLLLFEVPAGKLSFNTNYIKLMGPPVPFAVRPCFLPAPLTSFFAVPIPQTRR